MKTERLSLRLDEKFLQDIKNKAMLENITVTDLILRSVSEYVYKDVNIQNELLGTLEQINANLKVCMNNDEFFESFFIHYLKYFFVIYNETISKVRAVDDNSTDIFKETEGTKQLRLLARKKGAVQRDECLSNFKGNTVHLKKICESLLADTLLEESSQGKE